jgi:pimeloyl-ACP methyl ester carboxylesterase
VILIHGADDVTVDPSQSSAYAERADTDVDVTILDGCGHMDIIDPTAPSWPAVVAALGALRNQIHDS